MATSAQYEHICETMIVQLYDRVKFLEDPKRFKVSSSNAMALRLTWNAFIAGDSTERGFQMFCRMFKNEPATQKLFSFAAGQAGDQMRASGKLLFHVSRVVSYITKTVNAANNLEDIVPLLKQVGGRHGTRGYNVNGSYFPHLGKAMRELMKEDLKNFSDEHDALWVEFFGFISKCMVEGQEAYGN